MIKRNIVKKVRKTGLIKSNEAVIVHGMFSGAGSMKNLESALYKNNTYNKIHLIQMPNSHKIIPQIKTEKHAEELAK